MTEKEPIVPDYQPWIDNASAQAEELQKKVANGTGQAIKSARAQFGQLYDASSEQWGIAQDVVNKGVTEYKTYEGLFFGKLKEGVYAVQAHPTAAYGVGIAGSLLLLRRPRRFLWRNTVGRLQSEEQLVTTADRKVKELRQSVELLKNESKKLEERARLAEEELARGRSKLKNTGGQLRSLFGTVCKTERHARRLMDDLRELPSRQALTLRAEVASMAAEAKTERTSLDKTVAKIASKYGISV